MKRCTYRLNNNRCNNIFWRISKGSKKDKKEDDKLGPYEDVESSGSSKSIELLELELELELVISIESLDRMELVDL